MNKPREGNVPGQYPPHSEHDGFDTKHPLERKVESGLAEPKRNTRRNYDLAISNGWTRGEFNHWCRTGETPLAPGYISSHPTNEFESAYPPENEDRSERIGRRPPNDDRD